MICDDTNWYITSNNPTPGKVYFLFFGRWLRYLTGKLFRLIMMCNHHSKLIEFHGDMIECRLTFNGLVEGTFTVETMHALVQYSIEPTSFAVPAFWM